MVDANIITSKLQELSERMGGIRRRCPESAVELAKDQESVDLISFYILVSVQAALDISSHIVSDENWASFQSVSESFVRLAEHGVINLETAEKMKAATGLRNLVAHAYAKLDVDRLYIAATQGLEDLENFQHQVAAWLAQRLQDEP